MEPIVSETADVSQTAKKEFRTRIYKSGIGHHFHGVEACLAVEAELLNMRGPRQTR